MCQQLYPSFQPGTNPGIGTKTSLLGCPRRHDRKGRAICMHRKAERKRSSARRFNKGASKTHKRNMVMRGGYRL